MLYSPCNIRTYISDAMDQMIRRKHFTQTVLSLFEKKKFS